MSFNGTLKKQYFPLKDGTVMHVWRMTGSLNGTSEVEQALTLPRGLISGTIYGQLASAPTGSVDMDFSDLGFEDAPGDILASGGFDFANGVSLSNAAPTASINAFENIAATLETGGGRGQIAMRSTNAGDTMAAEIVLMLIARDIEPRDTF